MFDRRFIVVPLALAACLVAFAGVVTPPRQEAPTPPAPNPEPEWLRRAMEAQTIEEFEELIRDSNVPGGTSGPFNEADMFFEENATDSDLGIHFSVDHASEDAWRRMIIFFPDGRRFMTAKAGGDHATTGVTGLFSESAEPSYDTLPREEFLKRYPPGVYTIIGFTIKGNFLMSTDPLTHDIPAEPEAITPDEGDEVDHDRPLLIRWERTPDPRPPFSVITGYEVIVTKEQPSEAKRTMSIMLLASQTSVRIPREFFEPGKQYKYEIIARETSHNQTITEATFRTESDD